MTQAGFSLLGYKKINKINKKENKDHQIWSQMLCGLTLLVSIMDDKNLIFESENHPVYVMPVIFFYKENMK